MKLQDILLPVALCFACSAQTPEPASKELEAALRARVDQFYQASVSGKFREALAVVADDSLDRFLQGGSARYEFCEPLKITFSEDRSKADVIEKCKARFRFHGLEQHTSVPVTSMWKLVDGQWFWYWLEPTEVRTPFGVSKIDPENKRAGATPTLPDGKKATAGLYNSVKLDRKVVNLSTSKVSQDVIYLTNGLQGGISLSLPKLAQPGLSVAADKIDVGAGEGVQIVFKYDVNDPAIACMSCSRKIRGSIKAEIRIIPTGQIFPIDINFTSDEK